VEADHRRRSCGIPGGPLAVRHTRAALKLHQSASQGSCDGFGSAKDVELCENISKMTFDGGFANEKNGRYLLIAFAPDQKREHFQFTSGQSFAADARGKLLYQPSNRSRPICIC
jgi:hypothetical protein